MKAVITLAILFLFSGCKNQETEINQSAAFDKSWGFSSFEKADDLNPILKPTPDQKFFCPLSQKEMLWEERNVFNPAAVVKGDKIYLFYRAQDISGTSRIGLATSTDGLHFVRSAKPVFYPDDDKMKKYEWSFKKRSMFNFKDGCKDCFDGVEDPRIIETSDNRYIMTYTSYDGKIARLSVASSDNLTSWTKHGLAFKKRKHKDLWSKAGAIVVESIDGRNIAKKIDGKYWMYFGDTNIFLASSKDLINWDICINEENEKLISVLHPRSGFFDSRLVEPGPYALYREEGILLIYNSSNAANFNDPNLPKFTYAAGQALFDKVTPHKLVDRTKSYFIHPDKDYEKIGEVNEVCFVEGLVRFKNKWFLYYGTADSKIAVAVNNEEL